MQRALKRESKVLEIVIREAIKSSVRSVLGLSSGRRAPGGPHGALLMGCPPDRRHALVPECTSQAGGPTSVLGAAGENPGEGGRREASRPPPALQPLGHTAARTEGEMGSSTAPTDTRAARRWSASRSLVSRPASGGPVPCAPVPLPTGRHRGGALSMRGPGRCRSQTLNR